MSNPVSFENQIFTWENWDEGAGPMSLQFYNVELVVPVGEFPVGTKFPNAFILGDLSILALTDDQGVEHAFALALNVGAPVALPEPTTCDEGCTHH